MYVFNGGPFSNNVVKSSKDKLLGSSYVPARSLSVRFSFLRYSSNANFDVITPVASRILEISAAADPCGMFTVIISKFVSDKLSLISLLSMTLSFVIRCGF